MKDATHHLRHVQRKILQAARREENEAPIIKNETSNPIVPEKKVSANNQRRNNRLPGHNNFH